MLYYIPYIEYETSQKLHLISDGIYKISYILLRISDLEYKIFYLISHVRYLTTLSDISFAIIDI